MKPEINLTLLVLYLPMFSLLGNNCHFLKLLEFKTFGEYCKIRQD